MKCKITEDTQDIDIRGARRHAFVGLRTCHHCGIIKLKEPPFCLTALPSCSLVLLRVEGVRPIYVISLFKESMLVPASCVVVEAVFLAVLWVCRAGCGLG